MKKTKEIIKEIEKRIKSWEEDRKKINEGFFKNHIYSRKIDSSINEIVLVELIGLLRFAIGEKDE